MWSMTSLTMVYGTAVWMQFGVQFIYLNMVWCTYSTNVSIWTQFGVQYCHHTHIWCSFPKSCGLLQFFPPGQYVTDYISYIDSWFLWVSICLNNVSIQLLRIIDINDCPISTPHTHMPVNSSQFVHQVAGSCRGRTWLAVQRQKFCR